MLKVLHFFKTSLPDTIGGVEQFIDQLCRFSRTYGIESSVLALTRSNSHSTSVRFNGYTLHRAKSNFQLASTDFSIAAFQKFSKLAKEADIIHYHFPWPFMDLIHFASRIKNPTLITYHSDIIKQKNLLRLYQPLMNAFLTNVDEIVATSPNYLISSDVLQKYKDKVSIIPIGLDKSSYVLSSFKQKEYWKNRLGTRFYLFIGVLRYYKGLHVLLEANMQSDIPVIIVGDGPMKESLQFDAIRLGLKNTYFLGAISEEDKAALLTLCYGVVFPSHLRSEAFGISLLEAAMYGKPMISCEIGTGTSFININNLTGLVVAPNNSGALKEAMLELWNNPDKAAQMGVNAELRFQTHFKSEVMIKKYSDIYYRISHSKR